MTVYFSYGANMDPGHMADRCPGASRLGDARLPEHRFGIAAAGYGTALPSAGHAIPGVLWELTAEHERALDAYEGVPEGVYRQDRAVVETADGRRVEAMLYLATDPAPGTPNPGYLEGIIATGERLGFSVEYLWELRRLTRR